jgi:hypothetical protein
MVVAETNPVGFDFILGTDWECAVRNLAERLERKSSDSGPSTMSFIQVETVSAICSFDRTQAKVFKVGKELMTSTA